MTITLQGCLNDTLYIRHRLSTALSVALNPVQMKFLGSAVCFSETSCKHIRMVRPLALVDERSVVFSFGAAAIPHLIVLLQICCPRCLASYLNWGSSLSIARTHLWAFESATKRSGSRTLRSDACQVDSSNVCIEIHSVNFINDLITPSPNRQCLRPISAGAFDETEHLKRPHFKDCCSKPMKSDTDPVKQNDPSRVRNQQTCRFITRLIITSFRPQYDQTAPMSSNFLLSDISPCELCFHFTSSHTLSYIHSAILSYLPFQKRNGRVIQN